MRSPPRRRASPSTIRSSTPPTCRRPSWRPSSRVWRRAISTHVFYTCGGSTANDSAVRIAHYYHGRRGKTSKKHVISRIDAYHGSTYLTGSITGRPADRSPYLHFIDDWIHHVSSPNFYRAHEKGPRASERGAVLRTSW